METCEVENKTPPSLKELQTRLKLYEEEKKLLKQLEKLQWKKCEEIKEQMQEIASKIPSEGAEETATSKQHFLLEEKRNVNERESAIEKR